MIRNIKFGKRFVASLLTLSFIGSSVGMGMHLYKRNEIQRVKGYLEDFCTEEHYVDMSKISSDYEIKDFSGEILASALKELDISYVRFNDAYVYDDLHVEGFVQKTATCYDIILGVDSDENMVYQGYEPIRDVQDSGITYSYPEGYVLEDIRVYAEPIRYDSLYDKEIKVIENQYEDSYSLVLEKKR